MIVQKGKSRKSSTGNPLVYNPLLAIPVTKDDVDHPPSVPCFSSPLSLPPHTTAAPTLGGRLVGGLDTSLAFTDNNNITINYKYNKNTADNVIINVA